eukprot:scaffold14102_cov128-Isochrysis_galbana.AAC.6
MAEPRSMVTRVRSAVLRRTDAGTGERRAETQTRDVSPTATCLKICFLSSNDERAGVRKTPLHYQAQGKCKKVGKIGSRPQRCSGQWGVAPNSLIALIARLAEQSAQRSEQTR